MKKTAGLCVLAVLFVSQAMALDFEDITPMPLEWASLTEIERNARIDAALAEDKTDERAYVPGQWECLDFALTLFSELRHNYGIPAFIVGLFPIGKDFTHAIDAVLVGDDPADFYDWRFIEPRDDLDFRWTKYCPQGAQVTISYPVRRVWRGTEYYVPFNLVKFELSPDGVARMIKLHPELRTVSVCRCSWGMVKVLYR